MLQDSTHRICASTGLMALGMLTALTSSLTAAPPVGERQVYKSVGDRYPEISPFHNISPDDPPAIVFLGTEDKLISVATGETFERKMHETDIACHLHLYEGQPHGFFNHGRDENRWYNKTVAAADEFLTSIDWINQSTRPGAASDVRSP